MEAPGLILLPHSQGLKFQPQEPSNPSQESSSKNSSLRPRSPFSRSSLRPKILGPGFLPSDSGAQGPALLSQTPASSLIFRSPGHNAPPSGAPGPNPLPSCSAGPSNLGILASASSSDAQPGPLFLFASLFACSRWILCSEPPVLFLHPVCTQLGLGNSEGIQLHPLVPKHTPGPLSSLS